MSFSMLYYSTFLLTVSSYCFIVMRYEMALSLRFFDTRNSAREYTLNIKTYMRWCPSVWDAERWPEILHQMVRRPKHCPCLPHSPPRQAGLFPVAVFGRGREPELRLGSLTALNSNSKFVFIILNHFLMITATFIVFPIHVT